MSALVRTTDSRRTSLHVRKCATNRLRRRQFKAVWQHDQDKICLSGGWREMCPFPCTSSTRTDLSSGDTSYLSIAHFELDLATTKWQGVDPAEYESQLRAFLREDEQSELARLHSKQTVRKALHLGTMALVSWRYQLHRNEIRPSGVANIRRHFILHRHRVCRSYSEGARPESHLRNGSFASFLRYTDHFRSTAINGHRQTGSVGPVRANSRHALALMFAVMQKPYTASALVREAEH